MSFSQSIRNSASEFRSPNTIARVLILSYFLGLATGLIGGTKLTLLTQPFLSEAAGAVVIGGVVALLCAFILVGFQRRGSALVLALILFWASYMTMHQSGVIDVSYFWRDMALIGGLLFSAGLGEANKDDREEDYGLDGDDGVVISGRLDKAKTTSEAPEVGTKRVQSAQQYRRDLDLARVS